MIKAEFMKRICVFCGSKSGNDPAYHKAAQTLGKHLATEGIELVYGGASVGLMGTVATSALEAGGSVIGILPQTLQKRELAHPHLTELRIVEDLFERKKQMIELSDAFLCLAGGLGTLDELFEVLTWDQIGFHQKAYGLLNTQQYYDPLMKALHHIQKEGFMGEALLNRIRVSDSTSDLIDQLRKDCQRAPS